MSWGDLVDVMRARPDREVVLQPGSLVCCGSSVSATSQFVLWDHPDTISEPRYVASGLAVVVSVDPTFDRAGTWCYVIVTSRTGVSSVGWCRDVVVRAL